MPSGKERKISGAVLSLFSEQYVYPSPGTRALRFFKHILRLVKIVSKRSFGMQVEVLVLVDIVSDEKQEMAWICAFGETGRTPEHALGKTAKSDGFHIQLATRKGGLRESVAARKENCFIERLIFRLVLGNLR
jgi:hypothetical protein